MKNKTKTKLKAMSDYTLSERLDGLCSIKQRLYEYRHVFEDNELLIEMIQTEIDDICDEQDNRLEESLIVTN